MNTLALVIFLNQPIHFHEFSFVFTDYFDKILIPYYISGNDLHLRVNTSSNIVLNSIDSYLVLVRNIHEPSMIAKIKL